MPEFLDRRSYVWVIEVFEELETQHPAKADGHVGVAGEVEVDLQRITNDADPSIAGVQVLGIHPECRICYRTKRIGDQHFLAQTETETLDAGCKPLQRVTTPENLFGDIMETDDWTRNQLRKHGDVNTHVERTAQGVRLAAIDVDEVRHRVKSEKRYAYWQPRCMKLRSNVFQARHMGEHAGGKKTGVLEIRQDGQVERDAQRQHHLLAGRIRKARHQQADQPVHGDRTDH